jgi:tRNA-Thr(GGU) m(6)t(6)A37 methyltransferase TsaA
LTDDIHSSAPRSPIRLIPVGVIHSPFKERKDAPRQGRDSTVTCTVEIFPEYAPAVGTMEGISYIWILYWMDRADRQLLMVKRSDWAEPRPVFTIRSPSRPNPLALSIGKILNIEDRMITVTGIEALDGSPVVDIKPYVRELDCIE